MAVKRRMKRSVRNGAFRMVVAMLITVGLLVLNGKLAWNESDNESDISTEEVETTTSKVTICEESDVQEDVKVASETTFLEENAAVPTESSETISTIALQGENMVEDMSIVNEESSSVEPVILENATQDEPKMLQGEEVINLLSKSLASNSPGYSEHPIKDTISAFGCEVKEFIAINTSASYNIWGTALGNATYSVSTLKNAGQSLSFDVALESGGKGNVDVQIFTSESDVPDYEFNLDLENPIPKHVSLELDDASLLKIYVNNNSSSERRIVFYNFELL